MIYHIIEKSDHDVLTASGFCHPASLDREGFIHCSGSESDVLAVANRFYRGSDIRVLLIDETRLGGKLKWEKPTHDDFTNLFPHVYGELDAESIRGVGCFDMDRNGVFIGIEKVRQAGGNN